MSVCDFRFDVPPGTDQHAVIEWVGQAISGIGGSLRPSGHSHDFVIPSRLGTFEGDLQFSGQTLVVRVTKKPRFVPCRVIEIKLAEYVARS